jgi:hypothetical protein
MQLCVQKSLLPTLGRRAVIAVDPFPNKSDLGTAWETVYTTFWRQGL